MSKTIIDSHIREQGGHGQRSLTAIGYAFEIRGSIIKAVRHCRWQGSRDGIMLVARDSDLAARLVAGMDYEDLMDLQAGLDDIPLRRGERARVEGAEWRVASTGWEVR